MVKKVNLESNTHTLFYTALNAGQLHLRSMDLDASDVKRIAPLLKNEKSIRSVSFSFNPRIGNESLKDLVQALPTSIAEIGMMNCGLGDLGASTLLTWMKSAPNLRMVCVEGNNFSETQRNEFQKYSDLNPELTFIF